MIRVIIVDDEAPARLKLRQLLANEDEIEIAAECANGPEAVAAIRELDPDLVFLDIQMPEMDGFEVLQELGPDTPSIIFVTAHDEHAIRAFDVAAVDYLLKPVEPSRFLRALGRVRSERQHKCLVASEVGSIKLIPVDEIEWIESADNYVRVHSGNSATYVRMTMKQVEDRLDRREFIRVHRSAMVRIASIRALQPASHGQYDLTLQSGARVRTSRTQGEAVRKLIRTTGRAAAPDGRAARD